MVIRSIDQKNQNQGGETIVVISGTPMEDKDKNSEIEMVGQRPIVIQEIDKKAVDEPVEWCYKNNPQPQIVMR